MTTDNLPAFTLQPELLKHPQIPKPLHGMNARSLDKAWWDVTRRAAYAKHDDRCWACGDLKRQPTESGRRAADLFAHEEYDYDYGEGTGTYKGVVALCEDCSNYVHLGRLQMVASKGEIPFEELKRVEERGDSMLSKIGLLPWRHEILWTAPKKVAPWSHWRLILHDGRVLPTLFRDYNQWARRYGNPELELDGTGWPK